MNAIQHICLIGLGEVGITLAEALLCQDIKLSCYDIAFADETSKASHNSKRFPNLRVEADSQDAVESADLVISAVSAEQALTVARSVCGFIKPKAWYWDINSVSPKTKIAQFDLFSGRARYVEGAIVSPIQPKGITSPILLAGPNARSFAVIASELGFSGSEFFSEELGKAAASKMCRSVIIKGMESLLIESLISARFYGVEEQVLNTLNNLMPGIDWKQHSAYMISRSLEHGVRRAEEMREAHKTVKEAGLLGLMSVACADTQAWTADFNQTVRQDELIAMLNQFRDQL